MHMQFTRSGHTELRANAYMITSTITVVLFSTVVRYQWLKNWSSFDTSCIYVQKTVFTLFYAFVYAGVWFDDETPCEDLASYIKTLLEHDIF